MSDDRCPVCGGVGWYLDYSAGGHKTPTTLELIPCIYPPCEATGRPIEHLSVNLGGFARAVVGPSGLVMAVGR